MKITIVSDLDCQTKRTRNLPWSTPPELIFVSFDSQESQLSNDAKSIAKGADHAELWTVFMSIPKNNRGGPTGPPPSMVLFFSRKTSALKSP